MAGPPVTRGEYHESGGLADLAYPTFLQPLRIFLKICAIPTDKKDGHPLSKKIFFFLDTGGRYG